jgi:lysozyme
MSEPAQPSHYGQIVGGSLISALLLAMALVMPWEGYRPRPYLDAVGILTVCYGHTGGIQQREYSPEECARLLRSDLGKAWQIVERCITAPMTDYQAAALTSFAFNVGPGGRGVKDGLCWLKTGEQPRIRKFANAGQWPEACAQLQYWVSARGKRLRGLERRRAAEQALCEGRVQAALTGGP